VSKTGKPGESGEAKTFFFPKHQKRRKLQVPVNWYKGLCYLRLSRLDSALLVIIKGYYRELENKIESEGLLKKLRRGKKD